MSSSKTGEAMKAPFPTWREVHDLKTEVTALQEQLKEAQSELSKAARLINCAGPLDHRVQVMKLDYSNQIIALQEQNRKLREACEEAAKVLAIDFPGSIKRRLTIALLRAALKDSQL